MIGPPRPGYSCRCWWTSQWSGSTPITRRARTWATHSDTTSLRDDPTIAESVQQGLTLEQPAFRVEQRPDPVGGRERRAECQRQVNSDAQIRAARTKLDPFGRCRLVGHHRRARDDAVQVGTLDASVRRGGDAVVVGIDYQTEVSLVEHRPRPASQRDDQLFCSAQPRRNAALLGSSAMAHLTASTNCSPASAMYVPGGAVSRRSSTQSVETIGLPLAA